MHLAAKNIVKSMNKKDVWPNGLNPMECKGMCRQESYVVIHRARVTMSDLESNHNTNYTVKKVEMIQWSALPPDVNKPWTK